MYLVVNLLWRYHMDIEFNDIKELYQRLTPALNAKVTELKRNDLDYIKVEDVWNYLRINKRKIGNLAVILIF